MARKINPKTMPPPPWSVSVVEINPKAHPVQPPLDTQRIEVLGRNRLVTDLLLAGLEVALPVRDRGVDLIAYIDLDRKVSQFVASPIQMKASSTQAFGLDRKYEKIKNLILAYVWGLQAPEHAETYALTYPEALAVADEMCWTATESWKKGSYSTSAPSKRLRELLAPHRMTAQAWWAKIAGANDKSMAELEPA